MIMKKNDYKKLILYIAIPLLLGGIVGFITSKESMNYNGIVDGWVFPIVWSILYILMGISSYIVRNNKELMSIYKVNLVINLLWPIIFFTLNFKVFGFFWILLLILVVGYMIYKFYNKNNAKYILFAVSSLIFIGAIGLVIDIGKITLIIYNFACTTGLCIFDAIYNTQKGDLIKECNIEKYDVEHVMFNSVLTCSSRFIGFTLILIVGLIDNIVVFKGLLAIIAILVLIYSRIIANIEREDKSH